ncbi:unnamed protein product [Orchesella dallaii]|uniref:Uncharacterized protein n=1 Tax=Orchesella dallaii TaxID=48710 RepID=A0ABP1S273_9HEXA
MAQSHGTASLNRFSGLPANDFQSHRQPQHSYRAATARYSITSNSNRKLQTRCRTNVSPQREVYEPDERLTTPTTCGRRPMTRCVTPISLHASEAHIHRIRSAASHSDFKQQCKVASSLTHVPTTFRKSKHWPSESDEDDADIESVDWSAPLDITTYLYKPEFVINPKQNCKKRIECPSNSVASTEKDLDQLGKGTTQQTDNNKSGEINASNDDAVECLNKKSTMKADIIADYIKSSKTRTETNKIEFDRQLQDCVNFTKHINNDIRDMKTETKRLEDLNSPRVKTWMKESREEIISRGYTILKRIYELNAELTEAAAKKHVTGPPGNHWMGLSRVEVIEIMQRIHKELDVPQDKYCESYLQYSTSSKSGRRHNSKKGKCKKRASKSQAPKTPRVRAPQMMPVHVPGPPHLHTNICIRPWEPQQDGWSQDDRMSDLDIEEVRDLSKSFYDDNNYHIENLETDVQTLKAPPPTSLYSPPSSPEMDECAQSKEWAGEDYVTLEVFNPVFRISR